jgi:ABC-type transport system involved in multi-copper enzyme maturation permease subunit
MLPGPVFTFELMTTARHGRLYLVRAFYAVLLLVILWIVHSAWASDTGGVLSSRQVQFFALSAFLGIAIGQELLALALTPALVAGVVADERQRKTLHYLMASQLTSSEIVLGKLLVRMLSTRSGTPPWQSMKCGIPALPAFNDGSFAGFCAASLRWFLCWRS